MTLKLAETSLAKNQLSVPYGANLFIFVEFDIGVKIKAFLILCSTEIAFTLLHAAADETMELEVAVADKTRNVAHDYQ